MNRVSICAVLLTLLVFLTNCSYPSFTGSKITRQTSILNGTPIVPVAEPSLPSNVPQEGSGDSCDFLQHTREDTLLKDAQDYAETKSIIMSVYALSEDEYINVNTSNIDGTRSHYYEWITAVPYFGRLYYAASGNDTHLHDIGSHALNENPPLFTLQDVFSCLGMPVAYGTFLVTYDDSVLQRYEYPVTSLSLYYSQQNLLLKLLRPTNNEFLNVTSKVYLFGTEVYAQATTIADVESKIEESYGPLEDWPPASWSSTP